MVEREVRRRMDVMVLRDRDCECEGKGAWVRRHDAQTRH